MARVEGKIALVTGAAMGIGKAVSQLLIEEGAKVIVSDIKDDIGTDLANELGPNAIYHHLDVSQESKWQDITHVVEKQFGRLDILVNNAGIIGIDEQVPQDPEHCSLELWRHLHEVNLDSIFLGCKYGLGLMKKHGGSIINMSSRSGVVGVPTAVAYASSKAAIRNHSKSVALYCAQKGYNIRCNSIQPAAILTPLWDAVLGDNEKDKQQNKQAIEQGIPLGYMGDPIDVAYAVLYLASDESKYMTGSELTLDGGILAGSTSSPKRKE